MKSTLIKLLCVGMLVSMAGNVLASSCNDCSTGCSTSCDNSCSNTCDKVNCKPDFLPISFGEDRSRDYAGVAHLQYLADQEDTNWHAELNLEYNQSFNGSRLGSYFFPRCNTLTVGPDGTADVRNVDVGLSSTFSGSLTIEPKIKNVVIEPAVYVGLDRWVEGLYLWFKVPIVNTRWELNCCETDTALGGTTFPNFQVSGTAGALVTATGDQQIQQAFGGQLTFGDKTNPLRACKILCCEDVKTGVADFPVHLGYNFINKDRGYLGLYIRTVFPTGTMSHRQSIFDAQVGYNRWQLGAGFDAGVRLYERDEDTSLYLIMDLYVTHIFKKSFCRCFDLKANGCFSRYLLMQEADANGDYTGKLVNFADVFTACIESQFNWNLDGLIFFNFRHKGWTIDLGYEIQARDKEKFTDCSCVSLCDPCDEDACNDDCCTTVASLINNKSYGIKGTLNVSQVGTPVQTQSTATISTGNGLVADATPQLINSSNFATQLDYGRTAIPRAVANKVWTNFAYTWADRDYPIFAGLGAEVVIGNDNKALRYWGVRGKVGVAYN